jgi:hypothetical protein
MPEMDRTEFVGSAKKTPPGSFGVQHLHGSVWSILDADRAPASRGRPVWQKKSFSVSSILN